MSRQRPANNRPTKRSRTSHSYHDSVPLAQDFVLVHSSEADVRRPGHTTRTERSSQPTQPTTINGWNSAATWVTPDDPEFALDPDSAWYDEAVQANISEEVQHIPTSKKKKINSHVSRRPHVVWKTLHRQSYLDELVRMDGRADFAHTQHCMDCVSRKVDMPGVPEFRCLECFLPELLCAECCVKRHRWHPLHWIQRWDGNFFTRVSLKDIGLKVQLNHASFYCENPIESHAQLLIIHTNGIHGVAIQYCGCSRAIPHHLQLLRRGLYPASQISIRTCASFQVLKLLHMFALTTKSSTYDFYRALERMTDNTRISKPKYRYRALFRMVLQWRHLKMLKWGGRANEGDGVNGTKNGELAIRCPSCPHPSINLPSEWETADAESKFIYTAILCMDANFRLKNQLVSNYSQDPGLGIGWAYMIECDPYEKYVLTRAKDEDISTCVGFQALAKANTKFSYGLRYTGVGAAVCGRSEMLLPQGVGNLQKGERYANMDYVFGSAMRSVGVSAVVISYDIACQWFINLQQRISEYWPTEIKIPNSTKLVPAIPKLHEPMHESANHQVYSLNFIPGVGTSDCECPERVWGPHNPLGNSTKSQSPGSRHDVLDDHFNFWNWEKYTNIGLTLARKYKAAVANRNLQSEAHRGLCDSISGQTIDGKVDRQRNAAILARWEAICIQWESEDFLKSSKNPYQSDDVVITETQVRKELGEEESERITNGGISWHTTSAASFIAHGLDLEDSQRRLCRLGKNPSATTTARVEGSIVEQRNNLRARIRAWQQLHPIYMPGLLLYQAQLPNHTPSSDKAEEISLWLPSDIPSHERNRVCVDGLINIEARLRTAQCSDALDNVRHILKIKSRMVAFKNKNVRGQREGTRSRAVIDRVHDRARAAAEKYRAARKAKLSLEGPGPWESEFRVLEDGDIRSYQDPNQLRARQPRRGIFEDDVAINTDVNERGDQNEDFNLYNEVRGRRDGTGETRRTLSWIWLTPNADHSDHSDDILRTEWAKSRARAARSREEVLLLKEEMRRVLAFLDWKTKEWTTRAENIPDGSLELIEGRRAFALKQAEIQSSLFRHFRHLWTKPLHEMASKTSADKTGSEDDDDEDDDEDEEDQENDDESGCYDIDESQDE